MDVLIEEFSRYLRSLTRFASSLFVYAVVKGVPSAALALLPIFPILFIPNPILLWLDKLTKRVLSPWYGYPPVPDAYFSTVNLAFGTHDWNFPGSTAHTFLGLPRQAEWSPDAARVLCMLSKIVYEEFLDAKVCQALLKELPYVKADLVAGFQFTRINFDGQPPGGVGLQSLQVGVIKMAKPNDPAQSALIVAFRGSEPFVQADWFMDFDFILTDKTARPELGSVHQGFRYGLGLDPDLKDLSDIRTYCRFDPNPGAPETSPPEVMKKGSAFSLIADVLAGVPDSPIYVTGHSLGGGMAHLFAVALAHREPLLNKRLATLYTFAQPRIGDRKFADTSNSLLVKGHYRLANAIDIVPRVPPTKQTYLPYQPSMFGFLERLLGRTIIEYQHAGTSRLGEQIIQPLTPLAVDHTLGAGAAEPPTITAKRLLYFGLGKLAWGAVCCAVLPPLRGVYDFFRRAPPAWAQAPVETLARVAVRLMPPVWPISDHFIGSYCNMYWSPVAEPGVW